MSHKADELKDSIRKINEAIEDAKNNTEFANDMINSDSNKKTKK